MESDNRYLFNKLKELLIWALNSYAFVATGKGRITGKQLAKLIGKTYSCEEGKNKIAKDVVERCISCISVSNSGKTKFEYNFGNVTLEDLVNWGIYENEIQ